MALKKPSDFFGVDKVTDLTEQVEKITLDSSDSELESKISSSLSTIDGVFKDIQEQLQESSKKQIGEIKEEVVRLYEVVDNIIENEIPKYKKQFGTTELRVESRISNLRNELCEHLESQVKQTKQKIEELYKETLDNEISSARSFIKSLYQSEIQIAVEKYVSTYSQEIVSLREEVFNELKKRPTTFTNIESKLQDLTHKYRLLSEGLLDQPKKQQDDPLTQQSAITIEQLNKHYQILVSRLQEKLATVGGGGEVRLRYLDDVVGIKTNPSAYDGKFLKYDHSLGRFVFETVTGAGGGTGEYASIAGFSTYAGNVGFATFAGVSGFATNANRAGIATYSSIAGFATVATQSGISTIASVAGFATNATRAGLATFSTSAATAGFSTVASIAGFSTVAAVAGFATNATRSGVSTLASYSYSAGFSTVSTVAGVATFATISGVSGFSTVAAVSGFSTVATQAGISTSVISGVASISALNVTGLSTFAGISTYTSSLFGRNVSLTGVITASSFSGSGSNLTGLTGASANTYGNASAVPQIVVDANGRITSITNVAISGGGGGGSGINVRNLGAVVGFAGTIDFGTGLLASTISSGISTITVGFSTYTAISGFSSVSIQAGVATIASIAGFSTVSSVAGFATVATQAGISSFATFANLAGSSGFSTVSSIAGFSTIAGVSGFATHATSSGISSTLTANANVNTSGIITASSFGGSGTNLTGIVTSLLAGTNVTLSGSTGQVTINAAAGGIVGIATTGTSFFNQINASGVVTASSFSGSASNLTGLTGASANTYGNATAVPQIIVDANGRITSISNVAITGGGGGGGTGIFVNNGSLVGFAGTVDFAASGISVSPLSAGIVTATVIAAPNAGFATFARWAGISTIASVSGFASVSTQSGVATLAPYSYVAGFSTYSGSVGFATFSGIAGFATVSIQAGVATIASVAGFATNATRAGVATLTPYSYAAGIATVATVSGVATFSSLAGSAGFSTVSSVAGFSTVSSVAGFSTHSTTSGISTSVVSVSGVASISALNVTGISTLGTLRVASGVVTATSGVVTFYGDFYGNGSTLSNVLFRDVNGNLIAGQGAGDGAALPATASNNVIIGNNAAGNTLDPSFLGDENVFIGQESGYFVTSGAQNVLVGFYAGYQIREGSTNVYLGKDSGRNTKSGSNNVSIGHYAGDLNDTGNNNVFIGAFTGFSTNASDKIVIGSGGAIGDNFDSPDPSKSVQLAIGVKVDAITPSRYWIVGNENFNIGIGTTNPTTKLQVERYGVTTGFGTFSATAGVTTDVDSFTISVTDFETAEYTLHFMNSGNIQAQKVLVMQNGTTAFSQEYAIMSHPNLIVSVGTTITAGVCKLQVTPETGIIGLTTYRFTRQTML